MSIMTDFFKAGYTYASPKGRGTVKKVWTDYELWCHVSMKGTISGVQVDRKSMDFKLPFELKSFETKKTNTIIKTVVERVAKGEGKEFYDDSIEEKLGGSKEILG